METTGQQPTQQATQPTEETKKARPTPARSYICTLNNPKGNPEEYLQAVFDTSKFTYVGGQLERGKEGTPHIQFYLHCQHTMRPTAVKAVLPENPHIEKCIVQDKANQYCLKEDTREAGPWEFGVKPQVKRNAGSVKEA